MMLFQKPRFTCKDCQDREVGCHSKCEKYKQEVKEHLELRNKVVSERHSERELEAVKMNAIRRMRRQHG